MEDAESMSPQHDFVQYGDNGEHGELDLNYGGLLPEEVEQEPETSPVHRIPAAYEESPPPRLVAKATFISKVSSRHLPWSETKPGAGVICKTSRPVLPAVTSTSPCHSSALILSVSRSLRHARSATADQLAAAAQSSLSLEHLVRQCGCWHVSTQIVPM